MKIRLVIASLLLVAITASSVTAREPNIVRDGSSEAEAISVPVPNAQSHDWQIAYLKNHFPEHYSLGGPLTDLNQEHAFIAHEKQGRFFDYYSFTIRGRKIEVYFDISKQVEEQFAQSHGKRK